MRFAIVIACFNGASTLRRQLDAVLGQEADVEYEVVVADNGSTDGSRAIVEDYASRNSRVRLVDASARRGLSFARNAGASSVAADALAFVDQDDEVGEGWLAAMVAALERDPFVAARLEHDRLNEPWTIAVRGRPQERELLHFDGDEQRPFAFGCTLGVRRELHDRIGGFDEAFVKGCEDADYCWRMQAVGQRLVFAPGAVVHYRFRSDLPGIFRQARNYGESEALLLRKHQRTGRGASRPRVAAGSRAWLVTIRLGLAVRNRATAGLALWWLGRCVGSLRGAIKYRLRVG